MLNRLAFSGLLHCIQRHFTLRFAPKRTAFSTKTQCIQHQMALHLAANRSTFSCKQPQKRGKRRFPRIKIHFARIHNQPHFAPKQTSARIDYLRQGERLVSKNGTHSVKNRTEKRTKLKPTNCKVDKLTSIWISKLASIAHLVALVMLGILALNMQLCHALKSHKHTNSLR